MTKIKLAQGHQGNRKAKVPNEVDEEPYIEEDDAT